MEIANHEYYVSLEVAKLLKKAGFDWETKNWWDYCKPIDEWSLRNYPEKPVNWNSKYYNYDCSAPTLEVAQRWLREVKNCYTGIDVFVRNLDKNNTYYNRWFVYFNGTRYSGSNYDDTQYYEDAQEAGIKKALEIILEIGE